MDVGDERRQPDSANSALHLPERLRGLHDQATSISHGAGRPNWIQILFRVFTTKCKFSFLPYAVLLCKIYVVLPYLIFYTRIHVT